MAYYITIIVMFKTIYNKVWLTISKIGGYCQGLYGYVYYIKPIQDIQSKVIEEIYEELNGNEEIDATNPMSLVEFVKNKAELRYVLLGLLLGDQVRMGRLIDVSYNLSIYSYAYIAASILLDPNVDVDLTFELQDVSEEEYLKYYSELL